MKDVYQSRMREYISELNSISLKLKKYEDILSKKFFNIINKILLNSSRKENKYFQDSHELSQNNSPFGQGNSIYGNSQVIKDLKKINSVDKEDNNIANVYQNANIGGINKKGSSKVNQIDAEYSLIEPLRPQEEYQQQTQTQNGNYKNTDVYDNNKRNALLYRFSPEHPIPEMSENYD